MCAARCAAVSHRVSRLAACPWRLYYTRYYTEAAISTGRPGCRSGAPGSVICTANMKSVHMAARHHLSGPWPMSIRSAAQIANIRGWHSGRTAPHFRADNPVRRAFPARSYLRCLGACRRDGRRGSCARLPAPGPGHDRRASDRLPLQRPFPVRGSERPARGAPGLGSPASVSDGERKDPSVSLRFPATAGRCVPPRRG
jgi:hypothetical protein